MVDSFPPTGNKIKVRFRVYEALGFKEYEVRGQLARTICWLSFRGAHGVTALEMSSWALRLADYVHTLRHDYSVSIHTLLEAHDGGRHARYVLLGHVEIISIQPL